MTPAEAVEFLRQNAAGKEQREKELLEVGYPCYTTQVGKVATCNITMKIVPFKNVN